MDCLLTLRLQPQNVIQASTGETILDSDLETNSSHQQDWKNVAMSIRTGAVCKTIGRS